MKSMAKIIATVVCIISLFSQIFVNEAKKSLIGVVVNYPPFVHENNNGSAYGFAIDLYNEILAITGHTSNYLYFSPDGRYGTRNTSGKWDGMIGEVVNNKADLAFADLTITEERGKAVSFTVPFLNSSISALMKKSIAQKIDSWLKMANQTEITYGTLNYGYAHCFFKHSTNPIVRKMDAYMTKNPRCYSRNYMEGLNRVLTQDYIFIGKSLAFQYITGLYCDLTLLDDEYPQHRSHAIAVAKDSPLLKPFNDAINHLIANGRIDELKQKWWKSYCV